MANFRETNMASLKEEWAILFQGPNRISRDESVSESLADI